MYHMIGIPPLDQDVLRFVWRNYEVNRKPGVYVKTVLTFGDRPAPTMAITAMRKTARLHKENHPKGAEAITKNAYVDDICDSTYGVGEVKVLTSNVDEILGTGGFTVKRWISNKVINAEVKRKEVVLGGKTETEKVLGTVWLPEEDKFSFKIMIKCGSEGASIGNTAVSMPLMLTKRTILSNLADVYDPIGAGAVVLIKSKVSMQELWKLGMGWDDAVPSATRQKWTKQVQSLPDFN